MEEKILKTKDVLEKLGISKMTLLRLEHEGKLVPFRRTSRSKYFYLSPTTSVIFNADVNGAFNILMKHLRKRIHISHESLFHPIKVKNDFEFCDIINSPMR